MVKDTSKKKIIKSKFSNRERGKSKKGVDKGSRIVSKSVRKLVSRGERGELSTQSSISRVLIKIREFESPLATSGDIIVITLRPDRGFELKLMVMKI